MELTKTEKEKIPMICCYNCNNLTRWDEGCITGLCENQNLKPIQSTQNHFCENWEVQFNRLSPKLQKIYKKYINAKKKVLVALNCKQLPIFLKKRLKTDIKEFSYGTSSYHKKYEEAQFQFTFGGSNQC